MAGITASAYSAAVSTPSMLSTSPAHVGEKEHHVMKHGKIAEFQNPWPSWGFMMSPWEIGKAVLRERYSKGKRFPDTSPENVPPVVAPQFTKTRVISECTELKCTWLGHACFYVEFPGGLRVLFDPVFSQRCSPSQWIGPKRFTAMPCKISELPPIDAVIISHNHYDHMDLHTIKTIHQLQPECHFFVPMRNKAWFTETGIHNCTELDWWEERDIALSPKSDPKETKIVTEPSSAPSADITARIGCLPAQHTSARTAFDRNHTLWASWSVSSGGAKVYFAGDTGYRKVPEVGPGEDDYGEEYKDLPYCPAFKEIGEHRGPFDLGLIPIGAYDPRHVMSPMHSNPFDSVNIFRDVRCKKAIGMHWGTWVLTSEPIMEPPRLLKAALKRMGLAEEGVFDICDIGEAKTFEHGKEDPNSAAI